MKAKIQNLVSNASNEIKALILDGLNWTIKFLYLSVLTALNDILTQAEQNRQEQKVQQEIVENIENSRAIQQAEVQRQAVAQAQASSEVQSAESQRLAQTEQHLEHREQQQHVTQVREHREDRNEKLHHFRVRRYKERREDEHVSQRVDNRRVEDQPPKKGQPFVPRRFHKLA